MFSDYTIPRVIQLKIILYCRRNARFHVPSSPYRNPQKCTARVLILPGQVFKTISTFSPQIFETYFDEDITMKFREEMQRPNLKKTTD